MVFHQIDQHLKKVQFALAAFGAVLLMFSVVWIWIVYRPPSVGYVPDLLEVLTGERSDTKVLTGERSYTKDEDVILDGYGHIQKRQFRDLAWNVAALSISCGLLLVTGFFIRNQLTSHIYFLYMVFTTIKVILTLCLVVFFFVLALGSQGHLEMHSAQDKQNIEIVRSNPFHSKVMDVINIVCGFTKIDKSKITPLSFEEFVNKTIDVMGDIEKIKCAFDAFPKPNCNETHKYEKQLQKLIDDRLRCACKHNVIQQKIAKDFQFMYGRWNKTDMLWESSPIVELFENKEQLIAP